MTFEPVRRDRHLIIVCGPTAVGKTESAILLAERHGTEIISADSRQVYAGLEIGTAQPDTSQLARIRHHLIATLPVTESYNAGRFAADADALIRSIHQNNETVIVCGGTGLYIRALLFGLDDLPVADKEVRARLEGELAANGIGDLQERLRKLDPIHHAEIDLNNPARLMRALEVCIVAGRPYSALRSGGRKDLPFSVEVVGLDLPREELFARINNRTETMMAAGWLDEAERMIDNRGMNALNTVGYKELFAYLDGTLSLDEAVHLIKQNTRRFAKRQLTWFKAQPDVNWQRPLA